MRNKHTVLLGFALSLSTGLMACQNNLPPAQTSAGLRPTPQGNTAPATAPELSPKPAESTPLQAALQRDGNHDRLTFSLGQGFKTQALDTSTLQYMRIWVTGPGIASPIYATSADPDNFINIAGAIPPVSIGSIPRGSYRVITAQFYDVARNPVAVAYAKAVYSSTESGSVSIEVNRRSIPLAEVISQITTARPDLLDKLNLEELKTILNNVMNWNGTSFTVDPSRFVTTALASLLINLGEIPSGLQASLTPGSDYIKETASYSFNVSGLVGNDKVIIRLADPTSPLITQGNGPVNITGILPGTWELSITTQAGITYTSGLFDPENVTFAAGDALNRANVTLDHAAPVISELTVTRGPRNSEFEIVGENFHTTAASNVVNFNQGASNFTAQVISAQSDRLRVRVPNVTDGGDYNVTVQVGARTSAAETFNVQKIWYIKTDGNPTAQGDSWANATTLQRALTDAGAGDTLWLQQGTYLPGSGDRNASFVIPRAMTLLGGFAGTEGNADQRNPEANPTILSGDQLQNDDPANISPDHASRQDNSYHVVLISNREPDPETSILDGNPAVLDGLIIEGGNANDPDGREPVAPDDGFGFFPPECDEFHPDFPDCEGPGGGEVLSQNNQGGGILGLGPVALNHVQIRNNSAAYGGGLLATGSMESVELNYSTFENNQAAVLGGGFYLNGGRSTLRGNTFKHNQAVSGGGAVYIFSGGENRSSLFYNTFVDNSTSGEGGALWTDTVYFSLICNLFYGNTAAEGGGWFKLRGGSDEINDNFFGGNSATGRGGGIHYTSNWGATQTLTNNSFIQNQAGTGGQAIYFNGDQNLRSDANVFAGNTVLFSYAANIEFRHSATDLATVSALFLAEGVTLPTPTESNGIFNLDINTTFQNPGQPAGADGIWLSDDDGFIPLVSSPLVGGGQWRGGFYFHDVRRRLRFSDSGTYPDFSQEPTIGAYEHNGKPEATPEDLW